MNGYWDFGAREGYLSRTYGFDWSYCETETELREAAKMRRKMIKQYGKQIKLDKNSRWIGYIDLENESPTAYFMRQGSKVVTYQVPSQGVSRWAVAQFINRQRRASQPDAESATPSHSQQEHGALGSRGAAPAVRAAGRAPHGHGPAASHLRRAGVAAGFESDGLVQEAPIVPQPACGCESMRKPGRLCYM